MIDDGKTATSMIVAGGFVTLIFLQHSVEER